MLKRLIMVGTAALMATAIAVGAVAATGNGAPYGPHETLNLIGVPNDKTADMDGETGGRIFVHLEGKTKIHLEEGEDFAVLDANGTDADGATFQLPNPDPENDGTTRYSVFARAPGSSGGWANLVTCQTLDGSDDVCSLVTLDLSGNKKFENVSTELLYIWIDSDDDGLIDTRIPLFADENENYYWEYDNHGLKLVQLRFYECETTVAYVEVDVQEMNPGQVKAAQTSACELTGN